MPHSDVELQNLGCKAKCWPNGWHSCASQPMPMLRLRHIKRPIGESQKLRQFVRQGSGVGVDVHRRSNIVRDCGRRRARLVQERKFARCCRWLLHAQRNQAPQSECKPDSMLHCPSSPRQERTSAAGVTSCSTHVKSPAHANECYILPSGAQKALRMP
jgi:hypothetical protein